MRVLNKKNAIYQEILERLLTRRYVFGQKILVKEISEETGVSRQPIMTALNSLQERGFVQITAQVGCQVVQPSSYEVEDFYHMSATVEGLIGSLAAERSTPDEIKRLREINEKISMVNPAHSDAAESYRHLNATFHRHFFSMARSPIVYARQVANFELSDFFTVQSCGFRAHLDLVTGEHDEIISALTVRDPELARSAAMRHIESVAQDVIRTLREAESAAAVAPSDNASSLT